MRHFRLGYAIVTALLLTTTNVWAAEGARQDNSGIFVWIFLGVCALIVAAQAIPAIFMLVSAARGVAEAVKERQQVTAKAENK